MESTVFQNNVAEFLGGAVYALEVAPSPWFSHVDVAHVLLGLTVALVFQGVWIDDLGLPRGRRSWS
jgi:predicted outer membrane repeat protein